MGSEEGCITVLSSSVLVGCSDVSVTVIFTSSEGILVEFP